MHDCIHDLLAVLESGREVVLCTIIGTRGSTPRSSGSAMLVQKDGASSGTVGGGLVEARVQQAAVRLFDEPAGSRIMDFDMTGSEAARMGMICGGKVSVMLSRIPSDRKTLSLYRTAAEHNRSGLRLVLVSKVTGPREALEVVSRAVLGHGGEILDADAADQFPGEDCSKAVQARNAQILNLDGAEYLVEPVACPCTAYIVGAGHVGLYTARLAAMTGFRTVVMDDRAEFANRERFPEAADIRLLSSFADCFQGLELNRAGFVIILTRGHLHDKDVLSQSLVTPAGYIGMIGSRPKREAIYKALLEEGFSQEDLDRVHCPIGLSIKAETPAEIGVSIISEMIQVRAEREAVYG